MTETTTDWQLIKRHVRRHTEADAQAAFGALVRRHMDMVYATCLRALDEPELAKDAAQAVFLILARRAPAFRPGTTLPSWLFQTALLTANNVRRPDAPEPCPGPAAPLLRQTRCHYRRNCRRSLDCRCR